MTSCRCWKITSRKKDPEARIYASSCISSVQTSRVSAGARQRRRFLSILSSRSSRQLCRVWRSFIDIRLYIQVSPATWPVHVLRRSDVMERHCVDLKLDNMLFKAVPSDKYVEEQLAAEPLAIQGEVEVDGERYPILGSQPIRHNYRWDMSPSESELVGYVVTDLGQGERGRALLDSSKIMTVSWTRCSPASRRTTDHRRVLRVCTACARAASILGFLAQDGHLGGWVHSM